MVLPNLSQLRISRRETPTSVTAEELQHMKAEAERLRRLDAEAANSLQQAQKQQAEALFALQDAKSADELKILAKNDPKYIELKADIKKLKDTLRKFSSESAEYEKVFQEARHRWDVADKESKEAEAAFVRAGESARKLTEATTKAANDAKEAATKAEAREKKELEKEARRAQTALARAQKNAEEVEKAAESAANAKAKKLEKKTEKLKEKCSDILDSLMLELDTLRNFATELEQKIVEYENRCVKRVQRYYVKLNKPNPKEVEERAAELSWMHSLLNMVKDAADRLDKERSRSDVAGMWPSDERIAKAHDNLGDELDDDEDEGEDADDEMQGVDGGEEYRAGFKGGLSESDDSTESSENEDESGEEQEDKDKIPLPKEYERREVADDFFAKSEQDRKGIAKAAAEMRKITALLRHEVTKDEAKKRTAEKESKPRQVGEFLDDDFGVDNVDAEEVPDGPPEDDAFNRNMGGILEKRDKEKQDKEKRDKEKRKKERKGLDDDEVEKKKPKNRRVVLGTPAPLSVESIEFGSVAARKQKEAEKRAEKQAEKQADLDDLIDAKNPIGGQDLGPRRSRESVPGPSGPVEPSPAELAAEAAQRKRKEEQHRRGLVEAIRGKLTDAEWETYLARKKTFEAAM